MFDTQILQASVGQLGIVARAERWWLRIAVGIAWADTDQAAQGVRRFQATEADGAWHLARSIRTLRDPREKAIAFGHYLEEEAHADAFAEVYGHLSEYPFSPLHYERRDLRSSDTPPWKTFAYVHVGELDATARFRDLTHALPAGPFRDCLETVVGDEDGHAGLTLAMLERLGADSTAIRRELLRIRVERAWARWLRLGRAATDRVATAVLSLAYHISGPLLARVARRKLASGHVTDTTGIKHL